MAISAPTLDELVKPELKAEWDAIKTQWFPRADTPEHAAFDRRTPGKFNANYYYCYCYVMLLLLLFYCYCYCYVIVIVRKI